MSKCRLASLSVAAYLTLSLGAHLHAEMFTDSAGSCSAQMTCAPVRTPVAMGPEIPRESARTRADTDRLFLAKADEPPVAAEPVTNSKEKRWSSFLPFMAEEATKRGYQLPLPFGVSTVFTGLLDRKVDVTDVRVGVNGATPQSVSRFVNFGSTSTVFNANLKVDAWLLPFLNVYVLAGYVYNETMTRATITVPRPGPLPGNFQITQDIKTKLEGFVGGGGMTLAGGYRDFFAVGDVNYSQTNIGFDDRFKAFIATIRVGYQATLGERPLQLWVGQGYWNTANTAKGHTDVPGLGHIQFEADQGPAYPWMTDFGANLRVAKGFETVLDFGTDWHGGYLFVVAPTFRF